MMIMKLALLFVSVCAVQTTWAQQQGGDDKLSQVEIASKKNPELRSYAQMQEGLKAYQEKHGLAPDSELYFILIPKSKHIQVQNVTMRLASDEQSVPIPIDAEGKFQLPYIELKTEDEYDLILNQPKGQFHIKPYVKSANLPDHTKRFGDLRMECEVRWAIEKQDVSFVFSTYVKLLASGNPCTARTVAVWFFAPNGVDTISMETARPALSLHVGADRGYTLPLWNKELSDDSFVRYLSSATSTIQTEN